MTQLGPFTLTRSLGQGASGEVHAALHRELGLEVAIKRMVVAVNNPEAQGEFEAEVGMLAGLRHQNIVEILDYGIYQQMPWIALELCSAGTLSTIGATLAWPEVLQLLLELLDALGHAHAHGIIHRDIKPSNILLGADTDTRPGWRLTDFGVAVTSLDRPDRAAGTPQYMAPEQWEPGSRELGPWTDLYALGCVAYQLLSGHTPFHGTRGLQLLYKHRLVSPPPLAPRMELPGGAEAWVMSLLEKHPANRPQRAADAAHQLRMLAAMHDGVTSPALLAEAPTVISNPTAHRAVAPLRETGRRHPTAPPPTSWRPRATPALPPQLHGMGLSLFEDRTVPLVGREVERDRLWATLLRVHREQAALHTHIGALTGIGSTALLRWLATRVHETGAGTPVILDGARGADAVAHMTRTLLGVPSLQEESIEDARVALSTRGITAPEVHEALASMMATGADEAHKHGVCRLVLEAMATRRPVVLVVDRPSPVAQRFLQRARAAWSGRSVPVWSVLVTAPTEEMDWTLPPLRPTELEAIPAMALPIERRLAHSIAAQSGGSPGAALATLTYLARKGHLYLDQGGFRVRSALPRQVDTAIENRLERFLRTISPERRQWLDRAAVVGSHLAASDLAHFPEGWSEPRWLDGTSQGAIFRSASVARTLREALGERRAAVHGWWLERLPSSTPIERRGSHLMGANRYREALEQWCDELPRYRDRTSAGAALAMVERLLAASGGRKLDPGLVRRLHVHRLTFLRNGLTRLDEFERKARELYRVVPEPELRGRLAFELGTFMGASDWQQAAGWFERGASHSDLPGHEGLRSWCLAGVGRAWRQQGRLDWEQPFAEALAITRSPGLERDHCWHLADLRLMQSDFTRCGEALERLARMATGPGHFLLKVSVRMTQLDAPPEVIAERAEAVARQAAVLGQHWDLACAALMGGLARARMGELHEAAKLIKGPPDPFAIDTLAWHAHLVAALIAAKRADFSALERHALALAETPERGLGDTDSMKVLRTIATLAEAERPKISALMLRIEAACETPGARL